MLRCLQAAWEKPELDSDEERKYNESAALAVANEGTRLM